MKSHQLGNAHFTTGNTNHIRTQETQHRACGALRAKKQDVILVQETRLNTKKDMYYACEDMASRLFTVVNRGGKSCRRGSLLGSHHVEYLRPEVGHVCRQRNRKTYPPTPDVYTVHDTLYCYS